MSEKEEYAERPVPQHARLGLSHPALVWAGIAYTYTESSPFTQPKDINKNQDNTTMDKEGKKN